MWLSLFPSKSHVSTPGCPHDLKLLPKDTGKCSPRLSVLTIRKCITDKLAYVAKERNHPKGLKGENF